MSFAPEATLHTWNVVELPEDSTTSSASTNATRRASALTANAGSPYINPKSPMPSSDASEPPSTPPEKIEELQVAASPAHQRDLHQKKRRRSSGIPPMNFNNPDEFSSSPYSGASDDTGTQTFVTADEDSDSSSSNDNDLVQDETVTGVDGDDNTVRSTGSSSTESSGRLEAALQQAAKQAGTQGIDYDEHGDITMEMADDEVTAAFKPWMKKGKYVPQVLGHPSALQDQENLNPFSPAFKANMTRRAPEEEDGTMEMTQAVGRILPSTDETQASPKPRRRKSVTGNKRRSSAGRRRSSGDGSAFGDETMDLTTAIGGIKENQTSTQDKDKSDQSGDDDEELTMEFSSGMGGVVQPRNKLSNVVDDELIDRQLLQLGNRRESMDSLNNEEDMDITFAAGGILPSITERTEPIEDETQGIDMDITTAVGAILPEQLSTGSKAEAKILMEQETDVGQLSGSPLFGTPRQKPIGVGLSDERPLPALRAARLEPPSNEKQTEAKGSVEQQINVRQSPRSPLPSTPQQKPIGVGVSDERPLPAHARAMASETGNPELASAQTQGEPQKVTGRQSMTPKSHQPTPTKLNTPSKQFTPQMMRPTTPGKTPPSKNVSMRTASPKKLFRAEIKEAKNAPDSTPRRDVPNPLFRKDLATGITTPSIVLKPRRRRSSGLGIDREGIGSPRVTALLDRRTSISDSSKAFVAQGHSHAGVRFEDPQIMEQELDQERAEEKRRESGRGILEAEADTQDIEEKDHTANLKDMIERLTPQKKKLNGRKSLHVGAAKGLLGKRPAELDDDESEDGTPKRLKGREGSPVKKVKLPAPPPKTTTTGRMTRSSRLSLVEIAGNASAGTPSGTGSPQMTGTTPKNQPRFKDVESRSPAKVQSFEKKRDGSSMNTTEPAEQEDRIHLQDFLNMTSIRFMELTTTKRRHTVVPNALIEQGAHKASLGDDDLDGTKAGNEIENCVVAGACTVPMLELYQHVSHRHDSQSDFHMLMHSI